MKAIPRQTLTQDAVAAAKKSLCISLKKKKTAIYGEDNLHLWVPRFYPHPAQFPYQLEFISQHPDISVDAKFSGCLLTQPPQKTVAQLALQHIKNPLLPLHGFVLSLSKGFGKIFTILYAIVSSRKRAIIVLSENRLSTYLKTIKQFTSHLNVSVNDFFAGENTDLMLLEDRHVVDCAHKIQNWEMFQDYGILCVDLANAVDALAYPKFINMLRVPRTIGIVQPNVRPPVKSMDQLVAVSLGSTVFQSEEESAWMSARETGSSLGAMYRMEKSKFTPKELDKVRSDLHMRPKTFGSDGRNNNFNAYIENSQYLFVPRFYGIDKFGIPDDDDISLATGAPMCPRVTFEGTLTETPPQTEAVRTALDIIREKTSAGFILQLPCGFGKTVLSLYIAVQHGRRCLVLVHKDDLMEQWIERIEMFVPGARIGRLQRDVQDIADRDIVLGMVQSLASKNYDEELLQTIGLVIVDEAHHMAARYFSSAMNKLPAAHVIGLSATPNRKDGLNNMLRWTIGPVRFQTDRIWELVVVRQLIYTGGVEKEIRKKNGDPLTMSMITLLTRERRRNMLIMALIRRIVGLRRNLLLLSHKVDHLKYIEEFLIQHNITNDVGLYIGKKNKKDKERNRQSKQKSVILATVKMAKEGLDIPKLDTLILATPQGDVEQDIGRILRPFPDKQTPTVFDIKDPFGLFEHLANRRLRYVQSLKYDVQVLEADEYIHF